MVSQKRALEDGSTSHTAKKRKNQDGDDAKQTHQPPQQSSLLNAEEIDFPRGGGSNLTALEVKTIRAEGAKEAEDELFKVRTRETKKRKKASSEKSKQDGKNDKIRIEHLNYKRLTVGMKVMGQIVGILPLTLLVSLPNQLLAHIPITNISPEYTQRLERSEEDDEMQDSDEEDDSEVEGPAKSIPDLGQMFSVGQYIRAVVSATLSPGSSDPTGLYKSRHELAKLCTRVELSLSPPLVNEGVRGDDLKAGFTLTGAVRSVEDHGYILNLGVLNVDGFLSFKDSGLGSGRLSVGQLVNVTVSKLAPNKRTCTVTADPSTFRKSASSELSSVTSVIPGSLVQALVTDIGHDGVRLQLLGFFDGTVDRIHLRKGENAVKVGQKVKGRVLYQHSVDPPRFAVALSEHLTQLDGDRILEGDSSIQQAYPLGYVLDSAKVTKVEPERGLFLEAAPGLEGFVHISHISDDHVPSLTTSGPWKVGTLHRARVTGYHMFDGLLQLSLKSSIFEQSFLQLEDFKVGEIVKGTIKSVSDSAIFVSLSGNIDGVIWPNHFADIKLKHPTRRFKAGNSIKCKVLVVDPERKRIALSAKKTLLESDLPVLANIEDLLVGQVANGVVFRVFDKHLMIEFFNNLKASVSLKEASDVPNVKLKDAFPVGRVVRARITSINVEEGRVVASILQASINKPALVDANAVEIGDVVNGVVSELHAEHVILTLQDTGVRALLSIKNLANHRKLSPAQIHKSVKPGEVLEDLIVVTKNVEKSFVLVANKPQNRPSLPAKGQLSFDTIVVGQHVGGRITRHTRNGTLIKITSHIGGILHPTDTSDEYDTEKAFPAIDTLAMASVISIDPGKRQVVLSTRNSRLHPNRQHNIVDREIKNLSDVNVGDTVRGFVKNIAEHGLFVTIGRGIDARVQIRELFDEFVKDWKPKFKENQLVKGRVLSVDAERNQVEMTFKTGDLSRQKASTRDSVKEGQKVNGTVKRIENYGLFVDIEGTRVHGLCHKSQISDNADADVDEALRQFRISDRVKAVVLRIDKNRISLSLKPSLFDAEDFEQDEGRSDAEPPETFGAVSDEDDEGEDDDAQSQQEGEDASGDDDASDSDDDAMEVDLDSTALAAPSLATNDAQSKAIPSLSLSQGFQWFDETQGSEDDSDGAASSDEERQDGDDSKRKRRRKKEIQQDLTADLHTKLPDSNSDFERLLLGSPNSSYLWIQYMSFQLQISEIDKAREIGKRAIKTINFREEQERLNVWIAMLNLENVYGTEESLDAVFKEAARANDSKTVHLRLAAIFDQSGNTEKAEQQFMRTGKKFGKSCKVWALFAEHYLKLGKLEEARKLLPRSLQSLEKRKHLKMISRFAQLEYKMGEAERGRTLFEGIIDSHPKRWDLWSVYMDMEGVQRNIEAIRNLFERVLALKMTSHKAKSFFKKWLTFEKRLGDDEGIDLVKQKAMEWTQKATATSNES
ncbi:U3 snoRNP-associated protein Rrp5 [Coprinopsis marcescibilis]|uniref:U3 snoRNP-associated protein Rrp5 n=1 Tax=Coprinopsis marcescibilis TaxID=230819 RepID=A0A5C3LDD2_COPMA|nr:U3 snoRNP-associated protein Rrp5 [Coprinopsis marcescibilis]